MTWYLLKDNQLTQIHVFQRVLLEPIHSLHNFNETITMVSICYIHATGFSDIRKSTGDFLLKSLLLNRMGNKRKLTERERDWKQPNFWEKLSVLNLGQDIGCLLPFLTRLLSIADHTAILSDGKREFIMKTFFSCKNFTYITLNGHMLMEQGYRKIWAHTTHLDFIISLKHTKSYGFPL